MGDYTAVINRNANKEVDDEHYLFVIRPQADEN